MDAGFPAVLLRERLVVSGGSYQLASQQIVAWSQGSVFSDNGSLTVSDAHVAFGSCQSLPSSFGYTATPTTLTLILYESATQGGSVSVLTKQ